MNGDSKKKWARLSCSQVVDMIRLHAKNVGITKQVNPLTFRHTFATHMYEVGVSIDDLKEMMGHDDNTETTIYIHVSDRLEKEALEIISMRGGTSCRS